MAAEKHRGASKTDPVKGHPAFFDGAIGVDRNGNGV
jgi:hypothetical protein